MLDKIKQLSQKLDEGYKSDATLTKAYDTTINYKAKIEIKYNKRHDYKN